MKRLDIDIRGVLIADRADCRRVYNEMIHSSGNVI